ncbi:MAG: diphthine--ammonia ligase [Acidilobaceae archaeon]
MRLCVLISGGKDSVYSLHKAIWEGHSVECLIVFHSMSGESWLFHVPATSLVSLQAEAMRMKDRLEEFLVSGSKGSELFELENVLKPVIEKYDIEGIAIGVISSRFQKDRIMAIASRLGLKVYAPLWGINQEVYLNSLVREGFKIVIVKISTMGLGIKHLGVVLQPKHVAEIVALSKRYGFNPAFEGGEAETLVVDAPLFHEKLCLEGRAVKEALDTYRLDIEKAWLEPKNEGECVTVKN